MSRATNTERRQTRGDGTLDSSIPAGVALPAAQRASASGVRSCAALARTSCEMPQTQLPPLLPEAGSRSRVSKGGRLGRVLKRRTRLCICASLRAKNASSDG